MPVTPTGPLSLPLSSARDLIAAATAWQSWVEAADATEAAASVWLLALTDAEGRTYTEAEISALRPFALLDLGNAWRLTKSASGACYRAAGSVRLRIEHNVPEAYQADAPAATLEFTNRLGALILGLGEVDQGLGHLVPNEIQIVELGRSDEADASGDHFFAELLLAYNAGG
jgi:hypothetical protein